MNNLILLACAYMLSLGNFANGQAAGKMNIVVTNAQQKPMESTFVELLNAKDSSLVQFSTTGNDGSTEFKGLQNGNYIVFVPEMGNKSYISNTVTLNHTGEEFSLNVILAEAKAHNEVIVVGQAVAYNGKLTINSRP